MTDADLDRIIAETEAFMRRRNLWRELATVRGKVNFEWIPEINRLKREGRLEQALNLTYQCMDASERADDEAGDGASTWAGWVERAAVILRKMGDVEAEERLLLGAVEKFPARELLSKRLSKASTLAARSRTQGN